MSDIEEEIPSMLGGVECPECMCLDDQENFQTCNVCQNSVCRSCYTICISCQAVVCFDCKHICDTKGS